MQLTKDVDEGGGESHGLEHAKEERPVHRIIRFGKIEHDDARGVHAAGCLRVLVFL